MSGRDEGSMDGLVLIGSPMSLALIGERLKRACITRLYVAVSISF